MSPHSFGDGASGAFDTVEDGPGDEHAAIAQPMTDSAAATRRAETVMQWTPGGQDHSRSRIIDQRGRADAERR